MLCPALIYSFSVRTISGDNLDHSNWDPRSLFGEVRLDDKTKIMALAFELGLKLMN